MLQSYPTYINHIHQNQANYILTHPLLICCTHLLATSSSLSCPKWWKTDLRRTACETQCGGDKFLLSYNSSTSSSRLSKLKPFFQWFSKAAVNTIKPIRAALTSEINKHLNIKFRIHLTFYIMCRGWLCINTNWMHKCIHT